MKYYKTITILGYKMHLLKLQSGWYTVHVPFGDNEEDKAMFDCLVYGNTQLLSNIDPIALKLNIKNFIKTFKN